MVVDVVVGSVELVFDYQVVVDFFFVYLSWLFVFDCLMVVDFLCVDGGV